MGGKKTLTGYKKKNASLKSLLVLIILLGALSTFAAVFLAGYFYKNFKKQEADFYFMQAEALEESMEQNMRDCYVGLRTVGLNSEIRDNIFRTDVKPSEMRGISKNWGELSIPPSTTWWMIHI